MKPSFLPCLAARREKFAPALDYGLRAGSGVDSLVSVSQNQWLVSAQLLSWLIYCNLPFFVLIVIMIILFFTNTRVGTRPASLYMTGSPQLWLFAGQYLWIGALMLRMQRNSLRRAASGLARSYNNEPQWQASA